VDLDDTDEIIGKRNNLTCKIPSEMGDASNIEVINSYGNNFSDSISNQNLLLSNLKELILSQNRPIGTIPELRHGDKIEYMSLRGSQLTGTLPASIQFLPNAIMMNLGNNT